MIVQKPADLDPAMKSALKNHIMRKRLQLKQELEQDAIEKRLKREQEAKRKQDAMTLDQLKDQLYQLEKTLDNLKNEKHSLFAQLKQNMRVLNEDDTKRKQKEGEVEAARQQQQQQQNDQNRLQHQQQSTSNGANPPNLANQENHIPPQPQLQHPQLPQQQQQQQHQQQQSQHQQLPKDKPFDLQNTHPHDSQQSNHHEHDTLPMNSQQSHQNATHIQRPTPIFNAATNYAHLLNAHNLPRHPPYLTHIPQTNRSSNPYGPLGPYNPDLGHHLPSLISGRGIPTSLSHTPQTSSMIRPSPPPMSAAGPMNAGPPKIPSNLPITSSAGLPSQKDFNPNLTTSTAHQNQQQHPGSGVPPASAGMFWDPITCQIKGGRPPIMNNSPASAEQGLWWDPITNKVVERPPKNANNPLTAGDGGILWDPLTGEMVKRPPGTMSNSPASTDQGVWWDPIANEMLKRPQAMNIPAAARTLGIYPFFNQNNTPGPTTTSHQTSDQHQVNLNSPATSNHNHISGNGAGNNGGGGNNSINNNPNNSSRNNVLPPTKRPISAANLPNDTMSPNKKMHSQQPPPPSQSQLHQIQALSNPYLAYPGLPPNLSSASGSSLPASLFNQNLIRTPPPPNISSLFNTAAFSHLLNTHNFPRHSAYLAPLPHLNPHNYGSMRPYPPTSHLGHHPGPSLISGHGIPTSMPHIPQNNSVIQPSPPPMSNSLQINAGGSKLSQSLPMTSSGVPPQINFNPNLVTSTAQAAAMEQMLNSNAASRAAAASLGIAAYGSPYFNSNSPRLDF